MAQVIVCDDCMQVNQLTLAAVIQVNITVEGPDGTERSIKGVVSACAAHSSPVEVVAAWLGQDSAKQAPPTPPAPAAKAVNAPRKRERPGDEFKFRCPLCEDEMCLSERTRHATSRHGRNGGDIEWVPLFDVSSSGLLPCECGYLTNWAAALTQHVNATGHRRASDKHPLRTEEFETTPAKAVFLAATE